MLSKRKAPPNDDDDQSSLKLGSLINAYSVADAVRVASHRDKCCQSLHVFFLNFFYGSRVVGKFHSGDAIIN
jgi:hypothetical protein